MGSQGDVIDKFGDKVMCCTEIVGDTFRRRHDTVKEHIKTEADLAECPWTARCSASSLTSSLPLGWRCEERCSMVGSDGGKIPDFQITFPTSEGPLSSLAELKVVSAGVRRCVEGL